MRTLVLYILFFVPLIAFSQIGGTTIYEFVNTPKSARENALGGNIISIYDGDVSLLLKNPALMDSSYSGEFAGGWASLHVTKTETGQGNFAYSYTMKHKVSFTGGINFVSYGKFKHYDENENYLGSFLATDYEIFLGAAYEIFPRLSVGAYIKPILSYYETYSSYGLLQDYAVAYKDTSQAFTATIKFANVGWQLKRYTPGNKEPIPFSIDLGISKKLKHAPLRITATYEGLNRFDLSYDKILEDEKNVLNQYDEEKNGGFEKFTTNFFKHIHLAGEVMLFKSLSLNIGYNFRKAYELSFGEKKKAVGLCLGFNVKISDFSISYGWAKQHISSGTNYFTFTANVNNLYNQFKK